MGTNPSVDTIFFRRRLSFTIANSQTFVIVFPSETDTETLTQTVDGIMILFGKDASSP